MRTGPPIMYRINLTILHLQLNKAKLLNTEVQKFTTELMAEIEGSSSKVSRDRVSRGVEINQVYNHKMGGLFADCVRSSNEENVNITLANLSGFENQVLPNQLAFKITVGQLVESYKAPLRETADLIKDILIKGKGAYI